MTQSLLNSLSIVMIYLFTLTASLFALCVSGTVVARIIFSLKNEKDPIKALDLRTNIKSLIELSEEQETVSGDRFDNSEY
jgi:hypothetical protein